MLLWLLFCPQIFNHFASEQEAKDGATHSLVASHHDQTGDTQAVLAPLAAGSEPIELASASFQNDQRDMVVPVSGRDFNHSTARVVPLDFDVHTSSM